MQELDDNALLREYVERGSEEAFATLVARHINKVYSVALRLTRNPDNAAEITQSVFVLLAGKSRQLGKRVILSGWLYQTARLTAVTFIRGEIRRTRREQEAQMQTVLNENEPDDAWSQIAPLLDAAMAGLNETDRHAVVLRFFDGKSMREVGAALGATEDTAKKRVNRAMEKLQAFFLKRGVTSTTDTITKAISVNAVQAAPVALAKTVTAAALAKGAVAGGSTLTLAKTLLIAMKTKTAVITIAAAALVLGTGTYLVTQVKTQPHPHTAPREFTGIKFANAEFKPDNNNNGGFLVEVDPNTRRITNAAPAIHIKGPITPMSPEDATNAAIQKANNSSSTRYFVTNGSPLLGQHVRISGWLKTADVQNSANAYMSIWVNGKGACILDLMDDRPILGTTDWQQIEFVADIPNESCIIFVGPVLNGPGELWADDFQLEIAPPGTPITDDRAWRHACKTPNTYSEATDYLVQHDGHSTICLTYTADEAAARGAWVWWGQKIRPPNLDKYLGHTMRMSGWVKTENATGHLEPTVRPWDGKGGYAKDSMAHNTSLKGTRDWTKFSVTCAIAQKTQHIDTAFIFWGSGKTWIDMQSLEFEKIK